MIHGFTDPRFRRAATAACLLTYFLYSAWFGLRAHFAPDDMMNLGMYYRLGPAKVVLSQFAVWDNFYRPMGAAFYLPLYELFGLHIRAFRIAVLILLMINVYLLYRLARLLGANELAAGLAAFVMCFHRAMGLLYYNTSFVYDVLCFLFYVTALIVYVRVRVRGEFPGIGATLGIIALYLCALNSKEIAPTFPMILLAYEWVYHRPVSWKPRALLRWLFPEGRLAMITVPLTAAYVYGKTVGPNALASIPDYHPVFSLARVLQFQTGALTDLLYVQRPLEVRDIVIVWSIVTLIAWWSKNRVLRFCWWWMVLTPLPIQFVNRIGPALYIPLAGWAIFAAVVVAGIVNRISAWAAPPVRIPVAVGLVLLAVIPFAREGRASVQDRYKPAMADDGKLTATVIAQLNLIRPQVRPGARWLFLNDPFDYYDMLFIAQLWAHRRDMTFAWPVRIRSPSKSRDNMTRFLASITGS
jgi:hypothetical protein